jgi:hypothetical protein
VQYDGLPYPGTIMDVDEDSIEVKVMNRIGVNRFFWPLLDDICWYKTDNVITLLDQPPENVTKRHCKLPDKIWQLIDDMLG